MKSARIMVSVRDEIAHYTSNAKYSALYILKWLNRGVNITSSIFE